MKTATFWDVTHVTGAWFSYIYMLSQLLFYPEDGGCMFLQNTGKIIYQTI
jgi:hypothetical protein